MDVRECEQEQTYESRFRTSGHWFRVKGLVKSFCTAWLDLLLISNRHGFLCRPEQRNSAGLSAPRPGSGDVQSYEFRVSRATALESIFFALA